MQSISAINSSTLNGLGALNSNRPETALTQVMEASGVKSGSAIRKAAEQAESVEEVKAVFQEFVAGTFYSTMLKSLHSMHDKPAYMHGGQAEEIFQNQLDQVISKELATKHGEALVAPMLPAFAREINSRDLATASSGPGFLPRI
ncbi:MAG: hypothetical protein CMJ46_15970 [Planctomyces sp.]|nr:hypothetical protein [Planctomyces sp.]